MKIYYDLHIHSALSPCGDNDMTPNNIVNMAMLNELDMIAVTDHNSCANCRSAMKVGEKIGITVVPGMELCTSEEIHNVCLFPSIEKATDFSDYIHSTLPNVPNREKIFGEQLVMDDADGILGKEEILLTTASNVSISELDELVSKYDGVCYPAHIDRNSYSIISNLGTIDSSFNFNCAEVADIDTIDTLKKQHPYLNELKILSGSDAHYLEHMRLKEHYIEPEENSIEAILEYLKKLCYNRYD